MNMYVSNLGFHVQEEDLKQLFGTFGEVTSAKVIKDRETGRSRGFGFVEMPNDSDAKNAIENLKDISLGKKPLIVKQAEEKPPSKPGKRW